MHDELYYAKLYLELVEELKEQGFTVKIVPHRVLHDYAAMNPEAAKAFGKKHTDNVIELERGATYQEKCDTLNHEIIEHKLMHEKKWKYWPAHVYALKHEGDILPRLKREAARHQKETVTRAIKG